MGYYFSSAMSPASSVRHLLHGIQFSSVASPITIFPVLLSLVVVLWGGFNRRDDVGAYSVGFGWRCRRTGWFRTKKS